MLQTRTMILPSWFLVLFYSVIVFCISFVLGFLTKKMLSSKWQTLTFASMFIIVFCSIFYISEHRPVYTIVIPKDYVGEVRLFVSNQKDRDFLINKYGIGYIDKKTFDRGFYPRIIQGSIDITKQVKEYSKGALATTLEDIYSYEYLSFSILVNGKSVEDRNIEELIKIKAIDTTRLYKK